MKNRAHRYLPIATLFFTLFLILPALVAADESPRTPPERTPAGRAQSAAQTTTCSACEATRKSCTIGCFGAEDKARMVACLMGCDNAAAACSCDEKVTLRSEDFLPRPDLLGTKALACHSTTPCGSQYSSCASWSASYDCGDPYCGIYRWCGDVCGDLGCWGPALRQGREQYRVCFNSLGQSCTEYQSTGASVVSCGC